MTTSATFFSPERERSLPIGFDRICWKQFPFEQWYKDWLCLPIGFDRISWKQASIAYLIYSFEQGLPIGFDRICWKLMSPV